MECIKLKKLLKNVGISVMDIAHVLKVTDKVAENLLESPKRLSVGQLLDISYVSRLSVRDLSDCIKYTQPMSEMTDEDFEGWRKGYKGVKSAYERRELILDLCSITGLDIPQMIYSLIVNEPIEVQEVIQDIKKKGVSFDRLKEIREKYKDTIIPKYDLEEFKRWFYLSCVLDSNLTPEQIEERNNIRKKEGFLERPKPYNVNQNKPSQ